MDIQEFRKMIINNCIGLAPDAVDKNLAELLILDMFRAPLNFYGPMWAKVYKKISQLQQQYPQGIP